MERSEPDRLIYKLNRAFNSAENPDPEDGNDAEYWAARSLLEVSRQIERLEATIRATLVETRDKDLGVQFRKIRG